MNDGSCKTRPGHFGLQALVRRGGTRAALAALLGDAPKKPLLFDAQLSLDDGLGASLERAVDSTAPGGRRGRV